MAILPIKAGGCGGLFFSLRRSGVAGSGSGGNDSPPVRCCGLAFGGGPQSSGVPASSAAQASIDNSGTPVTAGNAAKPLPRPAAPAAALRELMRSMNFRRDRPWWVWSDMVRSPLFWS